MMEDSNQGKPFNYLLIRVSTVFFQNILLKFDKNEKYVPPNNPLKTEMDQLIREGYSIRLIWVKMLRKCTSICVINDIIMSGVRHRFIISKPLEFYDMILNLELVTFVL